MKIYTKKGDSGETSLVDGTRVSKTNPRLEAYGTVDELNAIIGRVSCFDLFEQTEIIKKIQNHLFNIGSNLATKKTDVLSKLPKIEDADVLMLEEQMDLMNQELPQLKSFVLPGGNEANSFCHMARTVCRRAERHAVALSQNEKVEEILIKYLNRLSDYFFMLSRYLLFKDGLEDVEWQK